MVAQITDAHKFLCCIIFLVLCEICCGIFYYSYRFFLILADISGYAQFAIRGNVGSQYQSYGVTTNGTLKVSKSMCYFNQVKFPSYITSLSYGITAYEDTTSTLLHCGGNLVNIFLLTQIRHVKLRAHCLSNAARGFLVEP